jgi:hypothetical protein
MILMAPCIIDFIGANALLGPVVGRGPGQDTPGPLNGIDRSECHLGLGQAGSVSSHWDTQPFYVHL